MTIASKLFPYFVLSFFALPLVGCGDSETTQPDPTSPPTNDAPFVTSAVPSEGAANTDVATSSISITFNEAMDTSVGSLSIDGGATLGAPSWSGQTVSVSVSDLAEETAYKVSLTGFTDAAGLALDGAPYLLDGALDFTTAPPEVVMDTTPPTVIDADPNEGQLDVALDVASVSVTFDEAMNTSVTLGTFTGGPTSVDLTGSWNAAGTVITFSLSGTLDYSTAYHVALAGYADLAGNPLDGVTYLGDGSLDFTTAGNPDMTAPTVVASTPVEGAANVDPNLVTLTFTFSEDMDSSVVDVLLTDDINVPQLITGVWSDNDTLFTLTLNGFLTPGGMHTVDLTPMMDEAGNLLDTTDAYLVDGILDFSTANPSGEGCTAPLVLAQATQNAGAYTWDVPSGAVTSIDGQFACDGSGAGNDVVIAYTKTSDTLANGGELLHVSAVGGTDDINLEITSTNCDATLGNVESCLWFKQSWDKFLDVPAGTYWVWVSDDDTSGSFPGAVITIEEIPATAPQAQGEGCFAPYTTASAIYTAPPTMNDPDVWTIPASINGFEIAPSSASVGSISCDNHPTYGDIHGADAVIEYQKMSASSLLLVEVNNLDPTITQSDLDVEVLNGCDTLVATSLYCGANADTYAFTVSGPMGPVYVWVASEATGEEFNGAEVKIREFTPGLGESQQSAEPLAMSGPIAPTSTVGLDRPSCFPPTGNIHWYSYTTGDTLFGVKGDAAAALAIIDETGAELACSTDTTEVAIGKNLPLGTTVYIAVESPSAISSLTLLDQTYTGLAGTVSNLNITFPSSATLEYSMAVGATEVFMGSTSEIWSFPKAGNATAVEHNTAEGIGSTQLGYGLAFAKDQLFSVDTTTSTTASRLFAVHDQLLMTWGPTAWDTPVTYPASAPVYAITTDGTDLIMASRETVATEPLLFMSVSATAPSSATVLGSYTGVYYVTGMAADAFSIYVVGRETTADEFLFRFDRSDLSAAPLKLARVDANTTATAVALDNLFAANQVYVRDDSTDLHVVANPGGATPIDCGVLLSDGGAADYAMTLDIATNTMFMFDSSLATNGGIITVQ